MTAALSAVLLGLLFCSAFCSSSEVALFSLSSMKVKAFRSDVDKRKQLVAKLLDSPRDILTTIIMLNMMINILVQNVTSSIFGAFPSWIFSVGVPLSLTLIFAEVVPKSVGMANNVEISYRVAPVLLVMQKILFPARRLLSGITHLISRLFFFFLKKEEEISLEELEHALKASKSYGILNEDEAEIVRGYLNLRESQVKEVMRPREEVIFFDLEESLSKLVHLFVDQECSRLPVCRENLDSVLGIISSQAYFLHKQTLKTSEDVIGLLHKPFFIPEGTSAEVLLRQMYDRQESLAIVVDEYGSTSGLIALEDLVEKVVGEIADARDEKSRYTRSSEDVIIASGKMELSEFEEVFHLTCESKNHMVTLGGWITEQVGDIPKTGSKYTVNGCLFHILSADAKRVRRVYVRRLRSPKKEER